MVTKAVVVMGVSSCGKTTMAKSIACAFDAIFLEGDNFHTEQNIKKMRSGQPLNDQDRKPWLVNIGAEIARVNKNGKNCVVACSALKREYRDILRVGNHHILFIYLKGTFEVIHELMLKRENHFMPIELLRSQFETLEEPTNDEPDVISIDITTDFNTEFLQVYTVLKEQYFT